MTEWIKCSERMPERGVTVMTKIADPDRNEQSLRYGGSLWFMDDGVYVYYTPTHWMPLPEPPKDSKA